MKKAIGIIGFGNMGRAIGERLKSKYQILVFDKDRNKTKDLSGIDVAEDLKDLIDKVQALILAVKPQDLGTLLNEIRDYVKGKLVISIAAGITTEYIEKHLGDIRVIRVMPNLPARIGRGMICLAKGKFADESDLNYAKELFDNLGSTLILKEDMMDAATAVSGSGPGYLYDWAQDKGIEQIKEYAKHTFIPSLMESAENVGFTKQQAQILAAATGEGSIIFLEETKLSPLELKQQIASKGGTTEAGLEVLHKGGSLQDAVLAAINRAKQLSRS